MTKTKKINLALQGGGAHGAFGWGVLDYLLEDGRLTFDGISGTSAGSMNAVVCAYGLEKSGCNIQDNDAARESLHDFWYKMSRMGNRYSPVQQMPFANWFTDWEASYKSSYENLNSITRMFSPYQLNPLDINPLRDVLAECVDFEKLNACNLLNIFITATNVRTGNVKVFNNKTVTLDAVMASACLPNLYKAVHIDGEYYWDGGYMGNPSLFPLFYNTTAPDILIVHINPIERPAPPTGASEIANRVNEISFNSSLLKEFRAIAFVQKLLDEGWLKDEYRDRLKYVLPHSIRADLALADLSVTTKFVTNWDFLQMLRDRGRASAQQWLQQHYDDIGIRGTVDLRSQYLELPA